MIAPFRLFQHFEVGFHLGLVLEGGAVDALELRVFLVSFVVGAGDAGELEGADVAGAHRVRASTQIEEIAVLEIGNRFAFGDVCEIAELEFAWVAGAFAQTAEAAAFSILNRLFARDNDFLENMVGFDLLFHLLLDLREILGGDAMREVHVVIEAVLDGRAGGELGFGPEAEDSGGHDVGAGVADALQFGHLGAFVEGFAFSLFVVVHKKDLTAKNAENAKETDWRLLCTLCSTIAQFVGWLGRVLARALSRSVWSAWSLLPLSNVAGHPKREQAPRTPYASRNSAAVSTFCFLCVLCG